MICAQFNDVEEFFEDVWPQPSAENGDVMRVCVVRTRSSQFPIFLFTVVAGVINDCAHLIELRQYCGDAVPGDENATGPKAADKLADEIRKRAKDLGFDVRAGRYLEAESVCAFCGK